MRRPSRIKILGKPWSVEWVESIDQDGDACYGVTIFDDQTIRVLGNMKPLELEQETLLHELTHALLEAMGEDDDHDEKFVTQFAKHWLAVIKDNPGLLTFLRARKR